ncbi:MAG: Cysteine desulfurase [Microgenomates group bacterium ADurb.Bin219]|nr:MAG: Cysteine desulfurase [Microgenomates group bacterium ADurb.Bin219]HNP89066.1 cysteine desulfurase family protein [Candidatus Woesebacteria bacterium]
MEKIYLDYAATTPVRPEVIKAMEPYWSEIFGNPSEPHGWGQQARVAIEESRNKIADFLGAKTQEIIFTSCATESINLAHKGLVEAVGNRSSVAGKPHVITSEIEHKAVLETCRHLEKSGMAEVTYLPVDKYGLVKVKDLEKAIKSNTVLVSVMYVNNEVGTIEPIAEIGQMIKVKSQKYGRKIYFHTDATQGIQYLDCHVDKLGVDLLSFTGHKFYAPKGVGVLYVRDGVPLIRQQDGGGQERDLRSGTENTPYIVGLGRAVELVGGEGKLRAIELTKLRDKLIKEILKRIPDSILTGSPDRRAPHIASFCFKGAEGEAILLRLDAEGIAASSGSACTSGSLRPSHVLLAMGIPPEVAHGSIRFSLGRKTTEEEIDYVLKVLPGVIDGIRKMAPKL